MAMFHGDPLVKTESCSLTRRVFIRASHLLHNIREKDK